MVGELEKGERIRLKREKALYIDISINIENKIFEIFHDFKRNEKFRIENMKHI
jgi:hypothetical protein